MTPNRCSRVSDRSLIYLLQYNENRQLTPAAGGNLGKLFKLVPQPNILRKKHKVFNRFLMIFQYKLLIIARFAILEFREETV